MMNTKLMALAKQAGFEEGYLDSKYGAYSCEHQIQKFAELIIQKCAEISEDNFHHGFAGAREMRKHFGLDEVSVKFPEIKINE